MIGELSLRDCALAYQPKASPTGRSALSGLVRMSYMRRARLAEHQVPAYLVFGRDQIEDYVQLRRERVSSLNRSLESHVVELVPHAVY